MMSIIIAEIIAIATIFNLIMEEKKYCWEVHSGAGRVKCYKHELIRETKKFVIVNNNRFGEISRNPERKISKRSGYGDHIIVYTDKEEAENAYAKAIKVDIERWQKYIGKLQKELEKYEME
jgi:hypothetical protein